MAEPTAPPPKPLHWVGSSLNVVRKLPEPVKDSFGFALYRAQRGAKHRSAKPLKGFGGGAGILEIVQDNDGNTYRAVYTVRFRKAIYVLHAFQKKSKTGIRTPKNELDLVAQRLKSAAEHYTQNYANPND